MVPPRNTGYANGLLNPMGHLEDGEDVAAEEAGIGLHREDLVCVHVTDHCNPEGRAWIGFFFRAAQRLEAAHAASCATAVSPGLMASCS